MDELLVKECTYNIDIINFKSVFETLSTRPQLIFEEIKYCVIEDPCAPPDKTHQTLKENGIYSLTNASDFHPEYSCNGEVLLNKEDFKTFVAARAHSCFIIAVVDQQLNQIHCCLYVNCETSICNLKISSKPSQIQGTCNSLSNPKIEKVVKWLTAKDFQFKSPPNNAVCPKQYYFTYQNLKNKYAKSIFDAWDMQTDPSKFIHEDIGIASYLICIWKARYGDAAQDSVKFADIGCGNGLLVYLLNQENFNGIGIDVKSRNIWQTLFSESTFLEKFFDPKNWGELSDCNWLIGNHSDELTPWLPYVASMISHECNFFVLPCCPWNFNSRYSRTTANQSIYQCYLNFVESVVSDFGFKYQRDVMKIPSTKRTCFVSEGRSYPKKDRDLYLSNIFNILKQHSGNDGDIQCVARSKEIVISNGSKLDKVLCSKIIDFTASLLLRNVDRSKSNWSAGESIHLKELIAAIKQEIDFSDTLRNQNGGIQTVLRNCHQLFIIRGGMVSLKDWSKFTKKSRKASNRKYDSGALRKSKMCWFFINHPQGCNLSMETCSYAHGPDDLRTVSL